MQYVEYIQTDGYCWFDTNIVPDITTKVEMAFTPTSQRNYPWLVFLGAQNIDDSADTFQIRRNDKSNRFEPKVDSTYVNVNYTQDTRYEVSLDKDTFVMNGNSYSIGATSMDTCNYTLFISAVHNPSWSSDSDGSGVPYRAGAAKFEEIKIYKNNVLVADLKPAIDNGNIGFYDSVQQAFRAKLGTGTPTAGPVLSSIVISPESKTFSSDGGNVQVSIQTQNSWVANPTDGSWYTISPTGGTGDSAVTISVPSYTGNTAREDTISFVDTNTTDEMVFTLKQKKYTTGQPFYLGGDEITEIYLGDDTINEAYLGEDLVFSTGPFEGLKVSPKSVKFSSGSLTSSIKVKSSEQWTMTTPAWISASPSTGDTGETIVTLTATAQTATTIDTIDIDSANYSLSISASYYTWEELDYIQNGVANGTKTTDFSINLGYTPTTATTVEITLTIPNFDGNTILSTDYTTPNSGMWWRFFTFQSGKYFFDCPNDSSARVNVSATFSTKSTLKMWMDSTKIYLQNGEGTPASGSLPSTPNFVGPLKLWTINYTLGRVLDCIQGTKIYGIKIYEGQTLAMDLKPAKVGNDVGLFDTIGGNLYQNSGNGTLLYGELS